MQWTTILAPGALILTCAIVKRERIQVAANMNATRIATVSADLGSTHTASGINIYSQHLIADINNSAIRIVDINNSYYWYQQFVLLISVIRITDISNSNCWYQQFELVTST